MMDNYREKLVEIFNSGDPEVRTWFLVRHNYWPFILSGSYALFSTIIGPAIMKNRKPFTLRMPMIIFNFSLVAAYLVVLSMIFWNLPSITFEQFCRGGPVIPGNTIYTLTSLFWCIYMLRYCELLDTVFFVLRKKDNLITFLHVFHHFIVPILGWIIFRTERSGLQCFLVLINAVVHVIMYSYYGLAAMGPHVRKYLWWKKYLTQLQIIQFFFIIVFVTIITPLSGCSMVHTSYIMDILFAPLFLYLFYTFYKATFKKKSTAVSNGVANKEDVIGKGMKGQGGEIGESTNGVWKRKGASKNEFTKQKEPTNGHTHKATKKES